MGVVREMQREARQPFSVQKIAHRLVYDPALLIHSIMLLG